MNKIKKLEIEKLHGTIDVSLIFNEGLNVIHGRNGTGKTTMANVIANVMRFDFFKLSYLKFKKIECEFFNGEKYIIENENTSEENHYRDHIHFDLKLSIIKNRKSAKISLKNICTNGELSNFHKKLRKDNNLYKEINQFEDIWYWPANRIIDEVNQLPDINKYSRRRGDHDLHLELFPKFTAKSSYLTISKISTILRKDRLKHLEEKNLLVQDTIEKLKLKRDDQTSNDFISSFDNETNKISEFELSFETRVKAFLEKANDFLTDKSLEIEKGIENSKANSLGRTLVLYDSDCKEIAVDGDISKVLSSGERQFIPMLYQAIKLEKEALIVDEPEVSLDVNWQEVLGKIFSEKEFSQIICFTHSYSFSESFKWEEETFYLTKENNFISNKRPSEVGL